MKPIEFSKATFLKSCLEEDDFPSLYSQRDVLYPEIAILGKSNVGKSSLINHLTQNQHLAFVSDTPGKTQLINFFMIDNRFILVDLPGYGFAKTPHVVQEKWKGHLGHYLDHRVPLQLILLVLDLRRELSPEDIQLFKWASFHKKQLLLIFSKTDKLSPTERNKAEKQWLQSIKQIDPDMDYPYLLYSIKEAPCRILLKQKIQSLLFAK